ncbi:MAG: hypothetical protein C5B45_03455 [Chlamydiae bacterium]|nr:MAG: hypothetical protein C5B45_03455 [Chlamydiota bacterium]
MLKWCHAVYKNPSKVPSVVTQCKESQFEGHSYQILDTSFREEVNVVAMASFSLQKTKESRMNRRQICHLYLDGPQVILAKQEIKQENRQYQAWIRNTKTVLQNMQKLELHKIKDYKNVWESSIESFVKELNMKNVGLLKECKRRTKEISCLEALLEEIQEENAEMTDTIDAFNQLAEISAESIYSSTETIVPEATSTKYVRRISKESGYSSGESIYNSTETIVGEEPEPVCMQANTQITELEKKNALYKEWIDSLDKKLRSNLTLNFIDPLKTTNVKIFEDLKAHSFRNVELKQKNEEKKKILQALKARLTEAREDNFALRKVERALQKAILWKDIHQHQFLNELDIGEEHTHETQIELEAIEKKINTLQEKGTKLNALIEKFTKCLIQTKKCISIVKT